TDRGVQSKATRVRSLDMERVRAHVTIGGRVQGGNFRAAARERARSAGVEGWGRNLDGGGGEAGFEGPNAAGKPQGGWWFNGPAPARVDRVDVKWEQPTGQDADFRIVW